MRIVTLILLFIHFCTSSLEIQITTDSEIKTLLTTSDESHLGFFGKDISLDFIKNISEQLGGLVSLFRLEIPSEIIASNEFVVFPFGSESKKLKERIHWDQSEFKLSLLIAHLDKIMEESVEQVNAGFLQEYMGFKLKSEAKIVLVLFESNSQKKHLAFRTLSQIKSFKQQFAFVRTMGSLDSVKGPLKLDKIPAIVCFYPVQGSSENPSEAGFSAFPYKGTMNYSGMIKFFNLLSNDDFKREYLKGLKLSSDQTQAPQTPDGFEDDIVIQTPGPNASKILEVCAKVTCAIAFDNFWTGNDSRFNETVQILKQVQKKFSKQGLRVVLLDGGCHQYLLTQLNLQLESLPGLIAYNALTLEFHPLMGRFTAEDISDFIVKMKTGTHKPLSLPGLLELKDLDCAKEFEIKETRKQQNQKELTDDPLLEEAIEELRAKEKERAFIKSPKKNKRRSDEL